MKKVLAMVAFVMIGVIVYAFNDENRINVDQQSKKEVKSGEVIVMNKEMFIKDVFDYEKSEEWKYKARGTVARLAAAQKIEIFCETIPASTAPIN